VNFLCSRAIECSIRCSKPSTRYVFWHSFMERVFWRTLWTIRVERFRNSLERRANSPQKLTRPGLRPGSRAASFGHNLHGVTPPASRDSYAGRRRAAQASARGPWPCSLGSDPLGGRAKPAYRSVRTVNLSARYKRPRARSRRATATEAQFCRECFVSFCA
jgi:hypothetical protein